MMADRRRSPRLTAAYQLGRRAWRALPPAVSESAPVDRARHVVLRALKVPPPPLGWKVLRSLEELDEALAMLDRAAGVSDEELRRGFLTFHMDYDMLDLPPDPFSEEYRQTVLAFYEHLHGAAYGAANEVTGIDVGTAVKRPFPYFTGSPQTAGDHLIAVGHLLRNLHVPTGGRILELGAGWGNPTVALSRLGYRVTAIDISEDFCRLIRERAALVGAEIDARSGDYALVAELGEQFDAVVFFESFHHAVDHQRLLTDLHRVLVPGGQVVFASEPIKDFFPVPWGPRLDGESLWAIRRNGWLELGFHPTYFERVLWRHGWQVEPRPCPADPNADAWIARRRL